MVNDDIDYIGILVVFMIIFCVGFNFFALLGFFAVQPEGKELAEGDISGDELGYDTGRYWIGSGSFLVANGLLSVGIGVLGFISARVLKINAIGMVLFAELFFLPYSNTVFIFAQLMKPLEGLALFATFSVIIGILTMVMLFLFGFQVVKMAHTSGIGG